MNAWKNGNRATVVATTVIMTAMALFGGASWSYVRAIGEHVKRSVDEAIPDEIHIDASKHELNKAREEAARAFESVKQLDNDQQQINAQRENVRREIVVFDRKLKAAKMLLDQAETKLDGAIDVAKISEEVERVVQIRDERARLEVELTNQAAKIEQLKNDLLASARQTLDDVERLRIEIEVTKSESHQTEAKHAIAEAEQIIRRLMDRRDAAGNVDRLLKELRSFGNHPTAEVTINELRKRIDAHLAH